MQKAVVDNLKYDPVYEGLLQAVTTASKISHEIIRLDPTLSIELLLDRICGILRQELNVGPHNWTLYCYHSGLQTIEIVDNNMGDTFSRLSAILKNKNIHLPFKGAFFPVLQAGAYELALNSAEPVVLKLLDVMKDYYPEFLQSAFFKTVLLPLARKLGVDMQQQESILCPIRVDQKPFGIFSINTPALVGRFSDAATRIAESISFVLNQSVFLAERQRLLESVRQNEVKFRTIAENAFSMITLLDLQGRYLYCNPEHSFVSGYAPEELLGKDAFSYCHPEDQVWVRELFQQGLEKKLTRSQVSLRLQCKDGSYRWVDYRVSLVADAQGAPLYLILMAHDITERQRAEEAIKRMLKEKELLLKEVHHRIKNNMMTLMSVLSLQATKTTDPLVWDALEVAYNRAQSMMILYDKLYQAKDNAEFKKLSTAEYIVPLTEEIVRNVYPEGQLSVIYEVEGHALEIKTLSSLGIIINELITNIVKYAFSEMCKEPMIKISFCKKEDDTYQLSVADNGLGFDLTKTDHSAGFGLELIQLLTEQLKGTVSFQSENGQGTAVTVIFAETDIE